MISLQQIINSSLSLRFVSILAQRLSRAWISICTCCGGPIVRQPVDSKLVRAVARQPWVIRGESLDGEVLNRVVHETFHAWARSLFDLYHTLTIWMRRANWIV